MDKKTKELFSCIALAFIIALGINVLRNFITDLLNPEKTVSNSEVQQNNSSLLRKTYIPEQQQTNSYSDDNEEMKLQITPMRKLSGLSADEIKNMRRKAVSNSIFASDKYTPNPDVYLIEDGLQWMGAYEITCNGADGNKNIGNGASRESVGILNPAMIFYINMNSSHFSTRNYCSEVDYLIPYKLTYNPKTKTISAYINYKDYYEKNKVFYNNVLNDTNARDLGYNYSYMDSFENIRFKHETNLSNSVVPTQGCFHRGYSCGLPEGCNNYSPYVSEYEFYLTGVPAKIHIKLWKRQPIFEGQKADLNYELIFD